MAVTKFVSVAVESSLHDRIVAYSQASGLKVRAIVTKALAAFMDNVEADQRDREANAPRS